MITVTTIHKKICFAFLFCISCFVQTAYANGQIEKFDFSIEVDSINLTKDNYEVLTNKLSVFNRYFSGNKFVFSSYINYNKELFETRLSKVNVSILAFHVTSTKYASLSTEKVGGNDCEAAEILCSNGSLAGNSGGLGVQELGASNAGCLAGNEHQSSWYYLNVATGGSLTMMIDPSVNSDDYDFAIWGPFTAATAGANCPPVALPLRCSFSSISDRTGLQAMNLGTSSGCGFLGLFACGPSAVGDVSEGAGGDSFVTPLTVSANQIYILLVDNFSISSNPYNMSFGGSAVLGCTPVVLPVEVIKFDAGLVGMNSLVNWTTASEENNDYFEIEWTVAPEKEEWEVIGSVKSYGNSYEDQSYQFVHKTPEAGKMNYYRLSQTDKNGVKRVHSDLVYVDYLKETKTFVKALNAMGQEVDKETKGMVIYYFSDGSSVKVFN